MKKLLFYFRQQIMEFVKIPIGKMKQKLIP